MKAMAAGRTRVPASSMKTGEEEGGQNTSTEEETDKYALTKRMLKQKVPQRSGTTKSSKRLCTVELIHLRL